MASKRDEEMMAGALKRRPAAAIAAEVATTIIGRSAQQVAATLLPVAQIVASRFQSRGALDEDYIEVLTESIRHEGLHDPIIVRPLPAAPEPQNSNSDNCHTMTPLLPAAPEHGNPDNCHSMTPLYELVAGHHRLEVYRRMGQVEIPAFVRYLSDAEAARALTTENTVRKGLGDWELYKHMAMLRALGAVRNNTDMASVLNVSRTTVQYLEAFGVLPAAARDLLDLHPNLVGYNLAQALRPYCASHPESLVAGLRLLAEGKLTQAGMARWIAVQAAPPPKAYRKEVTLPGGVKLVLTRDEARVTGAINFDRLQALIEANLAMLTGDE